MPKLKSFGRFQAGYLLLEATLALSVAAGLMTYYMRQERDNLLDSMAKAHGEQMRLISQAVDRYAINYRDPLITGGACCTVNGLPVPVVTPLAPTLQDLTNLGLLPNAVVPIFGGGYEIRLNRNPAACVITDPDCDVVGIVMTNAPVLSAGGQVSAQVIGKALEVIGASGLATGLANAANNNEYWGLNGTGPVAIPPGTGIAPAAGLMAVRVGWEQDPINNRYLRRDGSMPMTGNLNMGNQNINNAQTVNATVAVNTATLNATAAVNTGTLSVSTITGPLPPAPIMFERGINMTSKNINDVQTLSAGRVDAAGVKISVASAAGGSCDTGQIGRDSDGRVLACVAGLWKHNSENFDGDTYVVSGDNESQCGDSGRMRCDTGSYAIGYSAWVTSSDISSCKVICRRKNS